MFNHAFDIAFEVHTENSAEKVTTAELFAGLQARVDALRKNGDEIKEACGVPFDTIEI
jgi:hypothetical protein